MPASVRLRSQRDGVAAGEPEVEGVASIFGTYCGARFYEVRRLGLQHANESLPRRNLSSPG